ncbi:MAG: hypothetical protein AAFP02_06605, partial [Bacteroidota bacterium]
SAAHTDYDEWHRQCLSVADQHLIAGPKDVFMTREIFGMIVAQKFDLAKEMLDRYQDKFTSKKYLRFLQLQWEIRQKEAKTQPEAA